MLHFEPVPSPTETMVPDPRGVPSGAPPQPTVSTSTSTGTGGTDLPQTGTAGWMLPVALIVLAVGVAVWSFAARGARRA